MRVLWCEPIPRAVFLPPEPSPYAGCSVVRLEGAYAAFADHLNLWRLGVRPDPDLLSTAAAKKPETIDWSRELQGTPLPWRNVMGRLEHRTDAGRGDG